MRQLLRSGVVASLLLGAWIVWVGPRLAWAGGTVGTGSPSSCDEAALNAALVGGGVITFNCGGARSITFTFYKFIADDTTINGGDLIILNGSTSSFFQVFSGKSLTLTNITLANGLSGPTGVTGGIENFGTTTIVDSRLMGNRSQAGAGAILNHGTLRLINSSLSDNHASAGGGAVYSDGGIVQLTDVQFLNNTATGGSGSGGAIAGVNSNLTVQGSRFSNNHALDGGALYIGSDASAAIESSQIISNSAGYGGGIENWGVITVTNSSLSRNEAAQDGGGLWTLGGQVLLRDTSVSDNRAGATGGGMSQYGGFVTLNRVTISGNSATGNGGGIYGDSDNGLTNVTLSGNHAADGGGIYQAVGNATLLYVTVTGNTGIPGAGVFKDGASPGHMYLRNCLLVGNGTSNCGGVTTSVGHNMSSDTHCDFAQTGDRTNATLPLGQLALNGGPTLTHMPLAGSQAIDGGQCISGVDTDQRLAARLVGAACDVGAVEFGAPAAQIYTPVVIKP